MENLNTERKSIHELVKEADEKNMTVVIVGAGPIGPTFERAISNERLMCVRVENLNQDDQDSLARSEIKNPFETEPTVIKQLGILHDEIRLDSYKIDSKPFTGLGRHKFRGY